MSFSKQICICVEGSTIVHWYLVSLSFPIYVKLVMAVWYALASKIRATCHFRVQAFSCISQVSTAAYSLPLVVVGVWGARMSHPMMDKRPVELQGPAVDLE